LIKEKRILAEKVNYLKVIPFLKDITKTKLSKLTYFFEEIPFKRGQIVYKEGEECKFVYIVKEGEFELYKRMPLDGSELIDYTEYLSQFPQNNYKHRGKSFKNMRKTFRNHPKSFSNTHKLSLEKLNRDKPKFFVSFILFISDLFIGER